MKFMVGLWLLAMMVLTFAYTAILTAFLALPELEKTIDSLEELAANRQVKLTIELNTDLSYKSLVTNKFTSENV